MAAKKTGEKVKGINLKKIGAIVAGATILASSVAFAGGLMYQNTELVNENGEPLAKVIVGAGSQAVDGVVAAAISNKMANEAYKSTTLTAEVVGEATCTGGAEGEGTCDIVEGSETVTLEVTVPGAGIEGVHTFTTAIGDYVDRELKNRYTNGTDSDEAYTVYDDFDDEDGNPLQNFLGQVLTNSDFIKEDDEEAGFYNIHAGNFGPFAEATISDTKSGKEYKEREDFWVHGNNHWDEGDEEVYGEVDFAVYSALFDATGDYGIPVCPGDEAQAFDGAGDWVCDDLDTLPAHKVYIHFMGDDWVISELEDWWDSPACTATQDTEVFEVDGAIVKLAKEAVSGIINVGEIMEAPSGYKVRLDDISREVGVGNSHPAIITVLDANDNEICQDQVYPGQTKDDLCDETTGVKLHVYQTAPGLNFIAKWAEMAIYKDEIELESGEYFLDDDDSAWEVAIGWTTDGAGCEENPEYLRNILLYADEPDDMDMLEEGDVFPVTDVEDYEVWDLTYNGIDDEDADWDNLKYKTVTDREWKIQYNQSEMDDTCTLETDNALELTTSSSEFKTDADPWEFTGVTRRGDRMYYIDVDTATIDFTDCDAAVPPADIIDRSRDLVVFEDDDGDWYVYEIAIEGQDPGFGCGNQALSFQYKQAGSDGYVVYYDDVGPFGCTGSEFNEFGFAENAGDWDDPKSAVGNDISDGPVMAWDGEDLGAADWETPALGDEDYIQYVVGDADNGGYPFDGACSMVATNFEVLGYEGAVPPVICAPL
ncbi:hypothetical protein GF412_01175, partial [Candidatus Micrarchaeota archaeon]|nr:hypothetical protein [Candidatus Micrarchaeota archaeon]MBD3417584.1 hypothetical protein [Candidatus Micrarchaeota archaeon]